MLRLRTLVLVPLAAPLALFAALASASAGPPSPIGPGGPFDLHVRLFRALDGGDARAVEGMLSQGERGLLWSSGKGWDEGRGSFLVLLNSCDEEPRRASSAQEGLALLDEWTRGDGAGSVRTEIRRAWSDCPSGEMSYIVLEFDRTRTSGDEAVTESWRSTSLVSYENGKWTLWHFNASRI